MEDGGRITRDGDGAAGRFRRVARVLGEERWRILGGERERKGGKVTV